MVGFMKRKHGSADRPADSDGLQMGKGHKVMLLHCNVLTLFSATCTRHFCMDCSSMRPRRITATGPLQSDSKGSCRRRPAFLAQAALGASNIAALISWIGLGTAVVALATLQHKCSATNLATTGSGALCASALCSSPRACSDSDQARTRPTVVSNQSWTIFCMSAFTRQPQYHRCGVSPCGGSFSQ